MEKLDEKNSLRLERMEEYVEGVISGEIPACKLIISACERFQQDIESGEQRGIEFDPYWAVHAFEFFEDHLRHTKGEWAGSLFVLQPWQLFIIGSVFGWKKRGQQGDYLRRFTHVYIEIPRKNGKSTLAAGVGNYLFICDNEPGAEVYSAATKRDQAKIVWEEAKRQVRRSPSMNALVETLRWNMNIEDTASKFEPLGADADSMDGLNIHGAIIDELHAHKTRDTYDVLDTATGSRRQPLVFVITTAGFDRESICYEQNSYARQVLKGIIEDDSFFTFISTVDDEEAWDDPYQWKVANPNFGVSVKEEDIKKQCKRALEIPSAQNSFKRKRLNIWTSSESKWINMKYWDSKDCSEDWDIEDLYGKPCFGGLDLSSNTDITALVLIFPWEGGAYRLLPFFWIPLMNLEERVKRDRVPYDSWISQKLLMGTPGNVIGYGYIEQAIIDLGEKYNVLEIAHDRWGALQLAQNLDYEGFDMIPIGQGMASLSGPTKEMENLILTGKIKHRGNKVLRWMADNMAVKEDAAGNKKPDKEHAREKIDGIVASIMGLDRAIRNESQGPSVYEQRGVISL